MFVHPVAQSVMRTRKLSLRNLPDKNNSGSSYKMYYTVWDNTFKDFLFFADASHFLYLKP